MKREKRWLNGVEAAEYMGVDYSTLWRWRQRGELPYGIRRGKACYDRVVLDRLNTPLELTDYLRREQRKSNNKTKAL